jgi:hypothetical protein
MPTIGVIDDRRKARRTLTLALRTALPKGWDYIDSDPLPELEEYPSWITENDVVALILDERLHEQKPDVAPQVKLHVAYKGHDLVEFLRKRFPTLPIYIVTSFPNDGPVLEKFGDVEDIVRRDPFIIDIEAWVSKITRASQKFYETIQEQLAELSDLSLKVATGTATRKELNRVKALQNSLQTPFLAEQTVDRSAWLAKLQDKLGQFSQLQQEIETFLEEQQNSEMAKNTKRKGKATKKR